MFGSQMLTAANVRRPFVGTLSTSADWSVGVQLQTAANARHSRLKMTETMEKRDSGWNLGLGAPSSCFRGDRLLIAARVSHCANYL